MQTVSISLIKKELQTLPQEQLVELCLRIVKYKKENKELLHYLLNESDDEANYIEQIKREVEGLFAEINSRNFYFAKKSVRKILRILNKYIRYSGKPTTAIELLIHFCLELKSLGLDFSARTAVFNLYHAQIKKINKAIGSLHEDLQYDYEKELKALLSEQ